MCQWDIVFFKKWAAKIQSFNCIQINERFQKWKVLLWVSRERDDPDNFGRFKVKYDDKLRLAIDKNKVHIFDKETTNAIR